MHAGGCGPSRLQSQCGASTTGRQACSHDHHLLLYNKPNVLQRRRNSTSSSFVGGRDPLVRVPRLRQGQGRPGVGHSATVCISTPLKENAVYANGKVVKVGDINFVRLTNVDASLFGCITNTPRNPLHTWNSAQSLRMPTIPDSAHLSTLFRLLRIAFATFPS